MAETIIARSWDELVTQFLNDINDLKERVEELEGKCEELEQRGRD